MARTNGKLTKSEYKLIKVMVGQLKEVVDGELKTERDFQRLDTVGMAALRLVDWLKAEQVEGELDEVKCAMIGKAHIYCMQE